MSMEISLLGVRGSMPAAGERFARYGGDTLCVLVRSGENVIIIDAGTGICTARELPHEVSLLIGHGHFDHLMGLGVWTALAAPERTVNIYSSPASNGEAAIHKLFEPPLWPVTIERLSANTRFRTVLPSFYIGDMRVDTLVGNHPDGVVHYRISEGGQSMVYAVDCELTGDYIADLREFAAGCGVLICDAQLTPDDLPRKRGWGHSTWREAAQLGKDCGAGKTVLVHFDPMRTDGELDEIAALVAAEYPDCALGKQGEVFCL